MEGQLVAWSSSERKAIAAVEDYLERCADRKSGHGSFGARRGGGVSTVHPEVLDEERQQYFPALWTQKKEKKDHFVASSKALVGAPRREGSLARELAKMSGMALSTKEHWQKPLRAPIGR